jgi:hypothetical protein
LSLSPEIALELVGKRFLDLPHPTAETEAS